MTIHFSTNHAGNPAGKLADCELRFDEAMGPLAGLKLIGFAVWERRPYGTNARTVTFPARQYSVNGERRSFNLLRATSGESQDRTVERLRDEILAAFLAWETANAEPEEPAAVSFDGKREIG
jgi:hypothetical protein